MNNSKSVWKVLLVGLTCFQLVAFTTPAFGTLLSYDGFAAADYTVGGMSGQAYAGTGYAAGGSWNTGLFDAGGFSHPTLITTDGVHVNRNGGDIRANPDRSAGGVFDAAGLLGGNGNIGGAEVAGSLYYSFLGREQDGNGNGWAGFNLYNGGDEGFGVGQGGNPNNYSVFHVIAGEPDIGSPGTPVDGDVHFFVAKVDYGANGQDTLTAWLDPDPTLSEAAQAANISVSIASRAEDDNDGYSEFRMRGNDDGQWAFDEIRFGTTWGDVTPTIPEPSTILLALMGLLGALGLRRRRQRG